MDLCLDFNSYVSILTYGGKCKLANQTHDFMGIIDVEPVVKWIEEKIFNK